MVDDAEDVVVRFVKSWTLDAALPDERLAELVADDYLNHAAAADRAPGLRGAREVEASLRQAFSGLRFDIEDVISDGEKVVVRGAASGRHTGAGGPLRNLPVTGREFRVQRIHIFRVADGKIAEHWASRDDLGQLVQLGLLPLRD
jgi:predicted ester cyclase